MKRLSGMLMMLVMVLCVCFSLSVQSEAYAITKPASELESFKLRMNVDFGSAEEADINGKSLFVVVRRSYSPQNVVAWGKYPLVEYNNEELSIPITVDGNIYVGDEEYDYDANSEVIAFVADSSYNFSNLDAEVIDYAWHIYNGNNYNYCATYSDGVIRERYVSKSNFLIVDPIVVNLRYFGEHLNLPSETPNSITSSDSSTSVEMVPMYSISQIKDKGNYVVVARDKSDGKFYALSFESETGNRVLLSDVNSVEDLLNGYKFDIANDEHGVVLAASKTKHAENSTEAQLRTRVKNIDTGKVWSLKMGTGASVLDPLYDSSPGTFMVTYGYSTDASSAVRTFNILKSTYGSLRYASGFLGHSYFYGTSSDDYLSFSDPYSYLFYRRVYGPIMSETNKISFNNFATGSYSWSNIFFASADELSYQANHPDLTNGMFDKELYILTDVEDDNVVDMETYTKYVTPGDFIQSVQPYNTTTPADSLIFVTEIDGETFAVTPDGFKQCVVRDGANGYDKVNLSASSAWTPNNWYGSYFEFYMPYGSTAIHSDVPVRASRQSEIGGNNYLLPNSSTIIGPWDGSTEYGDGHWQFVAINDLTSLTPPMNKGQSASYLLVYSGNDNPTLSFVLGLVDGELTVVSFPTFDSSMSEEELTALYQDFMSKVLIFDVYGNHLTKYYPSSEDTEYRRYYRVYNLTDINESDELLIGYRDSNNELHLVNNAVPSSYKDSISSYYSRIRNYLPITVLDAPGSYVAPDTLTADAVVNAQMRYDTQTTQEAWAFFDESRDDVIWARGAVANGVGTAKKETSSQRKYSYVTGLGESNSKLSIRTADTSYWNSYTDYYYKAREVSFFNGSDAGKFVLRGGKTDQYLTYVSNGDAIEVYLDSNLYYSNQWTTNRYPYFMTEVTDSPTEFEVYRRPMSEETFTLVKHDVDGSEVSREERPQDSVTLPQESDISKDGVDYVFVGWTINPEKAGYLGIEDSANIFDYDDVANIGSVNETVRSSRELIGRCDPDNSNLISWRTISAMCDTETVTTDAGEETLYTLNLYPVYAIRGFSQYALAKDGNTNVMGIRDMKDAETGSLTPGEEERWLGSIYLDVYVDGELWVESEPMYFAYHNDNAADINLKFIESGISDEIMNAYIGGYSFSATDPVGHRFIDAVWAEQGGSEDGLKARYNWMTSENGGQLDNVRGGSHVHVYLSTPYQVKYYFDDGTGDGYKQLPYGDNLSTDYTNNNYYVTKGSENAIAGEEFSHRVVSDDDTAILLNKDTSSRQVYLDTDIVRGGYSKFLYPFLDHNDTFDVTALPTPPENKSLDNTSWVLRGETAETTVAPLSQYTVTETTYGTGNSVYAYKSGQDSVNTYHLYAKVKPNNGFVTIRKWFDMDSVMHED